MGCLAAESNIDLGTTFIIYLPITRRTNCSRNGQRGRAGGIAGNNLVMDDEELVREVVADLLEGAGYTVESTNDGAEANERFRSAKQSRQPFDLVILDLTVRSGMSGKETFRKLLQIDPGIKANVFSGYSDDPVMSNYREYGFGDVVPKRYKSTTLSKAIQRVIMSN